jgi:hypothetical protein
MKGEGLWADLLKQRFQQAVRRVGLNERQRGILDISAFRPPRPPSPRARQRDNAQLDLF